MFILTFLKFKDLSIVIFSGEIVKENLGCILSLLLVDFDLFGFDLNLLFSLICIFNRIGCIVVIYLFILGFNWYTLIEFLLKFDRWKLIFPLCFWLFYFIFLLLFYDFIFIYRLEFTCIIQLICIISNLAYSLTS